MRSFKMAGNEFTNKRTNNERTVVTTKTKLYCLTLTIAMINQHKGIVHTLSLVFGVCQLNCIPSLQQEQDSLTFIIVSVFCHFLFASLLFYSHFLTLSLLYFVPTDGHIQLNELLEDYTSHKSLLYLLR